jgi:hypothetical protein
MTFALMLVLNIVMDVAILGALAYTMSHPRKLTPHGPSVSARATRRQHQVSRAHGRCAPARMRPVSD